MIRYEFKVVPAPHRGEKARGVKTTGERFALALMTVMNRMGADGWDYLRADTLPCEERVGLTGKATAFHHMLVFRREIPEVVEPQAPLTQSMMPPVVRAPVVPPAVAEAPARTAPAISPMPRTLFSDAEPEPEDLGEVTRLIPKPRPQVVE